MYKTVSPEAAFVFKWIDFCVGGAQVRANLNLNSLRYLEVRKFNPQMLTSVLELFQRKSVLIFSRTLKCLGLNFEVAHKFFREDPQARAIIFCACLIQRIFEVTKNQSTFNFLGRLKNKLYTPFLNSSRSKQTLNP
jgi:hypothetical protein